MKNNVGNNSSLCRSLLAYSKDVNWVCDTSGNIFYASSSTERILGYSISECEGKNFKDFIQDEDLSNFSDCLYKIIEQDESQASIRLRLFHKDNKMVWIEGTLTNYINDPTVEGIVINFRNITEQMQSEIALLENEEKYKILFNSNPYPIWIFDDVTLKILEVNDAAVKHYGYSKEEFLELTMVDIRPKQEVGRLLEVTKQLELEYKEEVNEIWQHMKKKW